MSSQPLQRMLPVDPAALRTACGRFATGITVATVLGRDGTPYGLTANSFTSVSCSPPLVLICIDHRTNALPHFRANPIFGINVLEENQRDLSVRFSQRQGDRFAGLAWKLSDAGVPLLNGALAQLECSAAQVLEAGDHTIFIGEVFNANWKDGRPLVYYASRYNTLGG